MANRNFWQERKNIIGWQVEVLRRDGGCCEQKEKGFQELLQRLEESLPNSHDVEAWEREAGRVLGKNPEIPITQLCQFTSLQEKGKCAYFGGINPALRYDLMTDLIVERLKGDVSNGGSNKVTDFFDVEKNQCGMLGCQVSVSRKLPKSGDEYKNLSSKHDEDLGTRYCKGIIKGFKPDLVRKGESGDEYKNLSSKHDEDLDTRYCKGIIEEFKPDLVRKGESIEDIFERVTACRLRRWLEASRASVSVYGIHPRTISEVAAFSEQDLRGIYATLYAPGVDADIKSKLEHLVERQSTEPYVIGFSQLPCESEGASVCRTSTQPRDKSSFGWMIRPRMGAGEEGRPEAARLSAVLSVPSWWKRIDVEIRACWISAADARNFAKDHFRDPSGVCPHNAPTTMHRFFNTQLPRRIEEVRSRFSIDVVRAPYFDFEWIEVLNRPGNALSLEAGRSGSLVLFGDRLWRGTVVTLGGQTADEIEVMPDMKGVVARFRCVGEPASDSPQELYVWTSEGRTQPLRVLVKPWKARHELDDAPCRPSGVEAIGRERYERLRSQSSYVRPE